MQQIGKSQTYCAGSNWACYFATSLILDTSARFFYLKNIKKCVSTFVAKLGWTGWFLVLVYFGALTAISNYIAQWFLFSEELLFYEVFITVIVSTAVLYALARVYTALRDKNSTSKWWDRGLKVLSILFAIMGFVYLSIGLISYFSINDFRSDPELKNLDSELRNSIIQNSYRFGTLLTVSAVIAFVATAGISVRRKFGWYAAVSLVLIQIVAITGLLEEERVTDFILLPEITKQLTFEETQQIETVFVPIIINSVFVMLVANIITVTFLTLPRVLSIFNMRPDILSS
ncbi:MAG TPA: hypothetical protein VJ250_07985, partial [Nitrososphaeraceae archaeon]|nr:hypothetical protein [Nitrososphaeraceae archaeon]